MGRKCAVPHCYTGYRKCLEKASLYKVPDDDFFLNKWQEAISREDRPITPKDYVCEKHFRDEDILRKRIIKDVIENYQRPKLKPDAIPSIFPDLPEFILKMTKKRRKISTVSDIIDITKESETPNKDSSNEVDENSEITALNNEELEIKTELDEPMDTLVENEDDEDDPNGPKMYHCDECKYKTKYAHNLRTHKTKHLSGDDVYMYCEQCVNYKTKWESTYLNHMKTKHGINIQEILKCTFCQFKTKVKVCLTRHCDREHVGQATITRKFKCEYRDCDYEAYSNALLIVHTLVHKNEEKASTTAAAHKTFTCTECHFETNSKRHIVTHTKSAHNSGDGIIFPVETPKKVLKNVQKEKVSKAVSKLKCSRCPYRTHSQNLLEKHLVKHQFSKQDNSKQMNTLNCPKCSYITLSSQGLEDHQRTSCKANKFHCKECPFTFDTKTDYIKHILTHRNTTVESVNHHNVDSVNNQNPSRLLFDTVLIKEEHHSDDEFIGS
ncbi:hypothetical protein JTB14_024732 [Gonioctena quinquepunctata]|nr:hypothetical protein JTB14_024732 [Gonioctena quinquepunctata]